MPRGRPKKKSLEANHEEINDVEEITPVVVRPVISEKEKLQFLYQQLKDLKVHSIGDLEVLISRTE